MTETSTEDIRRDGVLAPHPDDAARHQAMLPTDRPQNHASNLLPLPDGDLLCVWFAGTQEGVADISIFISRLPAGGTRWTPAVQLSDDPDRSEQNPILFLADDVLWLIWTAQASGNQDTAVVRYRQSIDLGRTWGDIGTLFSTPGTFVRQPPVVTASGRWLLPIYYCRTRAGEKWSGNHDVSAVKISDDRGRSWREVPVPESTGCVHMSIAPSADGTLLALYRSRWADAIHASRSDDDGETWSAPVPTELPNNNSSIQVTALANGDLALIFNASSAADATERRESLYDEIEDENRHDDASNVLTEAPAVERAAFWGAPRAPMTLAISADGGRTWPWRRNLDEGDGYCMTNNSEAKLNREFSYPSVKQSADGRLHMSYTYFRQAIKYVVADEAWAKA
ncbi:MAG: glycosyl hydrolase [Variovorax sp.]|jgi:predicted neuraminidase|nr:MAG: glycosyl hydrolase [Variovorax sp.]